MKKILSKKYIIVHFLIKIPQKNVLTLITRATKQMEIRTVVVKVKHLGTIPTTSLNFTDIGTWESHHVVPLFLFVLSYDYRVSRVTHARFILP